MSHVSDSLEPHKRKRDTEDTGGQPLHNDRIPQPPPPPQIGNSSHINYLSKSTNGKIDLIQGDADTFADVLGLINSYEGVLSRQESLAANLGAKLTGPRLLRAMESAFEGPIIVSPPPPYGHSPVSWLDVVTFAKASPEKFVLSTNADGERTCQFTLNGVQAQILEDDWRLIVNGALNHFSVVPSAPLPEDETAELATLDIVEKRLQVLIKKADEVAKRARQLNYHLSGRKAAIHSRRPNHQSGGASYQSHNSSQHRHGGHSASYDLHADLLQQFQSHSSHSLTPRNSLGGAFDGGHGHLGIGHSDNRLPPINMQPNRSPLSSISSMHQREHAENSADHRPVVTSRIEKLSRGDTINPPCDRCRRLKMPCIKYLTACQGCTKKHAKCAWKSITDAELAWLERESGFAGESEPPPVAYSHAQSTSSRYDPTHDEPRHSGPESVGSRGEGSRPGSRGNQHASAPLSPGENCHGGHSRQSSSYMEVDREPARSPSRPWEREMLYRNDPPPQQRDLGLLSQIASTAAAAADARDSRVNHHHPSATPTH